MNQIARANIAWMQGIEQDIPYRERDWALTGRLNPDGTVDNDTTADLPDLHMWVRPRGRGQTSALIAPGMYDYYADYDRLITVGYNAKGEFVAIEPLTSEQNAALVGNTPITGEKRNTPLPLRLLEGLRVLPPRDTHPSGECWAFLEAYPPLGWLGGDVNVTAGIPASAGEFGWTSIYLNEDGTAGIHVHPAEVKPDMTRLLFQPDMLIDQLPYNVIPAGAVSLFNGQTECTRTNTRYEDFRLLFNKKQVDVSQIMMSADGFGMVSADGYYMVST